MGRHQRRLSVWVLLFWSTGLAFGEQAPTTKLEPQVFGAGVALVAVPVFVTDGNGKAVSGLTAEDFEVEDNGKRVPIVAFQSVDADAPSSPDAPSGEAELPLAMQAEGPRQFLFLIDLQFSSMRGLFFGRKATAAFVRKSLARGDLVAVGTVDPGGVRLLTNFSSDHENAARAIEGAMLLPAAGPDPLRLGGGFWAPVGPGSVGSDPLGLRRELTESGGNGSKVDQELAYQETQITQAKQDSYGEGISDFLAGLSRLVRNMSTLRGRKQIVLLSSGFAESEWMSFSAPNVSHFLAMMDELFRAAAESDAIIHTVTLDGIEGAIDITDERRGPNSGRGTLVRLAARTGGRFILPTNNFGRALGEVDQISRRSYVIAFEAAEPAAPGERPHRLKVRVRLKGLSVSHRPNYSLRPPEQATDAAMRAQAAEAISKGLSGGTLRLRLVTVPYRDQKGMTSVHVVLHIDGAALPEAAQGADVAVQVYGYAMRDGAVLDSLSLNTSLALSKLGSAIRATGLHVVTAFPVSPGAVDLRFFVRAGASGATGSIRRGVSIPSFTGSNVILSTPLFTLPLSDQAVVPSQPPNRPPIEVPFRLGGEPFLPDAPAVLTPGRARETGVFVWPARGPSPPFEVMAELAPSGRAPLPLRLDGATRVVRDRDGFDRYLFTVIPPEAPPGLYTLRVTFRDKATNLTTRTETPVVLQK